MSAKEQLQEAQEKLAKLDPNNRDHLVEIAALKTQIGELAKQVEQEAEAKKQIEEKHETRVQESQAHIASILDNLSIGGLTMRQMCASEDDYQVLRIRFQKLYEQQADNFSQQIKGYEEREIQLIRQNESLQERVIEVEEESAKLADTISRLENERDDAESKRDAAAREIESLREEVKQLKSWNDDLRTQIALGVTGSLKLIDPEEKARQEADEKERIERIKASRTVYDLKPVEAINPRNYIAKRALDGETVQINWTQLKSYIVLENESEVQQFRFEQAPKTIVPSAPLVPPALPDIPDVKGEQFPTQENQSEGVPVSDDGAGARVEDAPITRAEIEARFKRIEDQLGLKSWNTEDVA